MCKFLLSLVLFSALSLNAFQREAVNEKSKVNSNSVMDRNVNIVNLSECFCSCTQETIKKCCLVITNCCSYALEKYTDAELGRPLKKKDE